MSASEPAFSDTAGVTTTDTSAVWTSLGAVGSYTGGMAPFARLASAFGTSWYSANNTIYVASNHAESQATTLTVSAAVSGLARVLCHNVSGSYPPASGDLTTGATLSTTANVNIVFTVVSMYVYGLTLKSGVGVSTSSNNILLSCNGGGLLHFDNCSFWNANTSSTPSSVSVGSNSSASTIIWNNCTVKMAHAAQRIAPSQGHFIWQNTGPVLVSGSSVPTVFIVFGLFGSDVYSHVVLEALDLSQLTAALNSYNLATPIGPLVVRDCKLNAATTIAQPQGVGTFVQLSRSSS
jgi:hypothetical protein